MTSAMSPTVNTKPIGGLDFYEAIRQVVGGKKVTKDEWENEDYVFMKAELLHINRDGQDHQWIVSLADISGEDFRILEDEDAK